MVNIADRGLFSMKNPIIIPIIFRIKRSTKTPVEICLIGQTPMMPTIDEKINQKAKINGRDTIVPPRLKNKKIPNKIWITPETILRDEASPLYFLILFLKIISPTPDKIAIIAKSIAILPRAVAGFLKTLIEAIIKIIPSIRLSHEKFSVLLIFLLP